MLRSVSAKVAGDTLERLSRAVSLAGRAQFAEAYREIGLARPYAALVPAFESQVNRVRVAEVDHGIRTARALARRGDFKDAYLALDAVKEHSGLEPAYGAALRGVREDEVRWNIGVALMASRNGDFEGAQAQLGALGARGCCPRNWPRRETGSGLRRNIRASRAWPRPCSREMPRKPNW